MSGSVRFPEQFQEWAIGSFPNTWTVEPFSNLLTGIEAGNSPSCPNYPAPAGAWGILKVSAVTNDGFVPSENKHLDNARRVSQSLVVRHGDLLMTRCNTPELVGAACLVDQAPPPLLLCDKLFASTESENVMIRVTLYTRCECRKCDARSKSARLEAVEA